MLPFEPFPPFEPHRPFAPFPPVPTQRAIITDIQEPPIVREKVRQRTNKEKVLAFLKARRVATNEELRQVGGARAMARVHELKKKHSIEVIHRSGGLWEIRYTP